jgi:hypothetical protein
MAVRTVLEVSAKRSFASALDWPGWSRSGRSPEGARDTLFGYAERYANVARRAGVSPAMPTSVEEMEIVERLPGNKTTEFGAPSAVAAAEADLPDPGELARLVALLEAAWATFDAATRSAEGVSLATGPRGGGRTLDAMRSHVRAAEAAYLSRVGSRAPSASDEDPDRPMRLLRERFVEVLNAVAAGEPLAEPSRTRTHWPVRYAIRRAAWHVLDHAWELEDRAGA